MAYLALIRAGESEADTSGVFSGQEAFNLTQNGINQVQLAGKKMENVPFDMAFTSDLPRGKQTYQEFKKSAALKEIPVQESPLLRERSYGIYSGQSAQQAIADLGSQEELNKLFTTYEAAFPGGESLKLVSERVIDFYEQSIRPNLQTNKNVVVVLHKDALRTLIRYLEVLDETHFFALDPKQRFSFTDFSCNFF